MAALTVRGLDESTKARLRLRAAHNGRSMEAEVRAILAEALGPEDRLGWGTRMARMFSGVEGPVDVAPRTERARSADLG